MPGCVPARPFLALGCGGRRSRPRSLARRRSAALTSVRPVLSDSSGTDRFRVVVGHHVEFVEHVLLLVCSQAPWRAGLVHRDDREVLPTASPTAAHGCPDGLVLLLAARLTRDRRVAARWTERSVRWHRVPPDRSHSDARSVCGPPAGHWPGLTPRAPPRLSSARARRRSALRLLIRRTPHRRCGVVSMPRHSLMVIVGSAPCVRGGLGFSSQAGDPVVSCPVRQGILPLPCTLS